MAESGTASITANPAGASEHDIDINPVSSRTAQDDD